jgi:Zn-dependent peptidase ImmA (M78 family)
MGESEARRYAEVVCEVAQSLLRHIKPIPLKIAGMGSNPVEAAKELRSALRIPQNEPIQHLLREIEKGGVLVLALPRSLEGRDALAAWSPALKLPVISLSKGMPGDRLRMSAAHELGHIVLRHSKILHTTEEREAF